MFKNMLFRLSEISILLILSQRLVLNMPNVVLINQDFLSADYLIIEKNLQREPLGILAIGSFIQYYGYEVM